MIEAPLRDGKVNPVKPDPQVVDTLEKVMESEGVLLGEEVIRVMSNTTRLDPAPAISGAQTTITCPGRNRLDNAREGTPGKYEDGEPVEFRLGVIRIGNIAIASGATVDVGYVPAGSPAGTVPTPIALAVPVTLHLNAGQTGTVRVNFTPTTLPTTGSYDLVLQINVAGDAVTSNDTTAMPRKARYRRR